MFLLQSDPLDVDCLKVYLKEDIMECAIHNFKR